MHTDKTVVHLVHFKATPGGIEATMPTLIEGLKQYEFNAFVIRPLLAGQTSVYQHCEIPLIYGANENWKSYIRLWHYAFNHRYDVFHVFNIGPIYLLILKLAGVKRILYSIRGTIYWKTFTQKLIRKTLWQIAVFPPISFVANSAYSKQVFLNEVNSQHPIKVIYNTFSPEQFKLKTRHSGKCQRIVYVGRLVKGKNLFRWLEVAAYIHQHYPNTSFHLYGDGPLLESLVKKAQVLGIASITNFHGFTHNIAQAYQSADVLLFLSEFESFGNVVVESVFCGTPVIASNIPSMQEIFQDYPVFLVDLHKNLSIQVLKLIENYSTLRQTTVIASSDFRKRFSLQKHLKDIDMLYQNLQLK